MTSAHYMLGALDEFIGHRPKALELRQRPPFLRLPAAMQAGQAKRRSAGTQAGGRQARRSVCVRRTGRRDELWRLPFGEAQGWRLAGKDFCWGAFVGGP